jgi:hypothetical protein
MVLLAAAMAYFVLQQTNIASQGEGSVLRQAAGGDWKGKVSPILCAIGIGMTFFPRVAGTGALCLGGADLVGAG